MTAWSKEPRDALLICLALTMPEILAIVVQRTPGEYRWRDMSEALQDIGYVARRALGVPEGTGARAALMTSFPAEVTMALQAQVCTEAMKREALAKLHAWIDAVVTP